MSPDVHSLILKKTVAADMVEMLLGVDGAHPVLTPDRGSVPVNRLRGQCVPTRVDNQCQRVARHKSRVHAPGRRISKAGNRIATLGEAHDLSIALVRVSI